MALPKKDLRKITVGNRRFAWSATGNDGFISLTVAPLDSDGQLLSTAFGYHSRVVAETSSFNGSLTQHLKQQLLITPYLVHQVITYALAHGWQPDKKGQFHLPGLENHLDLRLGGISPAS